LAVLLLVAAFAWPYSPDAGRDQPTRESRVYILDNTLSAQTGDALAAAKQRLLDDLADAPPLTQIAVIELTDQPRTLVSFGDSRAETRRRVEGIEPSHRRGRYLPAFQGAADLLARSLGEARSIVLLSDGQANAWDGGDRAAAFLDAVTVELPEVEPGTRANVAVHDPDVRRVFVGDEPVAECSAVLFHVGSVDEVTLTLRANGEEVLRRELRLGGQPRQFTITAAVPADSSRWLLGEWAVESGDILPADDRAVFSLPPLRPGRVDVLTASPFVKTALAPDVIQGRWEARFLSETDLVRSDAPDTPPADVLLLDASFLHAGPVRDRVLDFLNGRRGVVLALDRVTPVTTAFLKELGIEPRGEVETEADERRFRYVFSEHPLFQPFRAEDFNDLLATSVKRYRRITAEDALPLIFSQAGDPLLIQSRRGSGPLFVSAFGWDRADTDWPVRANFIPFLDRLLRQARGEREFDRDYRPGEACVWEPPPGVAAEELVVTHDGKTVLRVPVADGRARFLLPDEPGHYTLTPRATDATLEQSEEVTEVVQVNPPPDESQLVYGLDRKTLALWTGRPASDGAAKTATTAAATENHRRELSREEIFEQSVWWFVLLAGLAAIVAETLWLARGAWNSPA
jgi:hypothetical protein